MFVSLPVEKVEALFSEWCGEPAVTKNFQGLYSRRHCSVGRATFRSASCTVF